MAVANLSTLVYNGLTLDPVTFFEEVMTPELSGDKRRALAYNHQVTVEGFYLESNIAGKIATIDDVLLRLRESGESSGTDVELRQNGTAYRTLAVADFLGGGPHPAASLIQDPKRAGFGVPLRVVFTGQTRPTGGSGSIVVETFTDTFRFNKQNAQTFTRRGEVVAVSGTAASSLFESKDPGAPDSTFELESKTKEVDQDDEILRYEYVYVQKHEPNPTSAADVDYSVSSTMRNGTEVWTIDGTIRFEEGEEIDASEIASVVQASSFPSAVTSLDENVVQGDRENELRFRVTGEQGFGGGELKEWTESVRTRTDPFEATHKSLNAADPDVKQVLGRPTVFITQRGRAIGTTRHPTPPNSVLLPGASVTVVPDINKIAPDLDARGKAVEYVTEWTYTITQINGPSVGQVATPLDPTASPLLNQAASLVVNPNT